MKYDAPRIEARLAEAGIKLPEEAAERFSAYLELILRWNSKLNLTSIRSEEQIVSRHFLECAFAAHRLPKDIATLLDLGSGAGFPGIPMALCFPEMRVTLAESRSRKAAFLREAVRVLDLSAVVYEGRAESMAPELRFDAVCLRAVDRMEQAVKTAFLHTERYLALFTTLPEEERYRESHPGLAWAEPIALPNATTSILLLGRINVPRGTNPA